NLFYAVAKRELVSGGLPSKYQQQLLEGIHCLTLMSKTSPMDDLQKFKTAFSAKYGSEEVPLLQVLDSQLGVGYGDFANIKSAYSFLNSNYNQPERSSLPGNVGKEDLASILLNVWHLKNTHNEEHEIEITDSHLDALSAKNKSGKLPPSISVIFRICGENLFIEDAGGASALSLIGRFSLAPEVHQFGKEIAELEQDLNPNVTFAEIAHICNHHSANINRRNHLRAYEIPVLTNSVMEQEKQICLSDITVSVVDDTVILYSNKLKKNIVPRLSSAYNYTHNCFPIFRFLCDVQRQHLGSELSLSLPALVPGLKFYPRVRYKSCVLQMAEWHFDGSEFNHMHQVTGEEGAALLRKFAGEKGLPRYFAYTHYDNFLVFDLANNDDVGFFLKEIKNKDRIVLKEFPFLESQHGTESAAPSPFLEQYVASLYLNEEVYKEEVYKRERENNRSVKKTDNWLYFKIYCHPLSSDIILCEFLFTLIKKCINQGSINEWFWVRYQDPEYHIRLRIQPATNKHGTLFETFTTSFHKLISMKLVHRFQTDIYQPESERYSIELLNHVEAIFGASSNLVSNFLKRKYSLQWNDEKVLIEGVTSVNKMLEYFGLDYDQITTFCSIQFEQFFLEFARPKNLKPEIEKLHKSIYADVSSAWKNKKDSVSLQLVRNNIIRLLQQHRDKKIRNPTIEKLAADIIHMHINRLFSYDQRYYEMVVYYLLYRSLTTEKHKAKSASS
ncbi:MAG: thiopeptide-type bacteriocin biosynthesis protein, partial [Chitinophagaceae bacterium]